jgi:TetR/AcrR family transcriptional regulator, regulator of cefoperazone and chloramphenicol sensitivity
MAVGDLKGEQALLAAALSRFAADGIAATSLRAVAAEAGVSPGLVVHHFGSKAGLCAALDAHVAARFLAAYAEAEQAADDAGDLLAQRSTATAAVMRAHPDLCAYLARALGERSSFGEQFFDRLLEHSRAELGRLDAAGALRPGSDELWRALQHVLLILGPLLLRGHVERALGGSLFEPEAWSRWVAANEELLRHGLYRDG